MTEDKYNTKDIRHIDEKSQEYIAKGNRMTEELYKEGMGYSYFNRMKETEEEANKFKENCKRLEQENKKLKKDVQLFKCLDTFGESECHCACRCLGNEFCEDADKKINNYRSALEEIRKILLEHSCADSHTTKYIINKINEVLQ